MDVQREPRCDSISGTQHAGVAVYGGAQRGGFKGFANAADPNFLIFPEVREYAKNTCF